MSEMVGPQRHCIQNLNKSENNSNEDKVMSNENNNIEFGYYMHRNKLGEGMGHQVITLSKHILI
jgi:hypothetical protein